MQLSTAAVEAAIILIAARAAGFKVPTEQDVTIRFAVPGTLTMHFRAR